MACREVRVYCWNWKSRNIELINKLFPDYSWASTEVSPKHPFDSRDQYRHGGKKVAAVVIDESTFKVVRDLAKVRGFLSTVYKPRLRKRVISDCGRPCIDYFINVFVAISRSL